MALKKEKEWEKEIASMIDEIVVQATILEKEKQLRRSAKVKKQRMEEGILEEMTTKLLGDTAKERLKLLIEQNRII